ncbi:hypothetical protein [Nonomuraea typhae]|uniref:Uncharacterized protein n=1 Tax=Nonomuraea typhae TaxID=2603600 RepID=A0ABW7YVD8_9ACTN
MHILDLLTSVLQLATAGAGLYAGMVFALRARSRDDRPGAAQEPGKRGRVSAGQADELPEHRDDAP